MSKQKLQMVKLVDIDQEIFVRKTLDQEWAFHLAQLMENKVELPKIWVVFDPATDKWKIVDGRHRLAAYFLLNLTEVEVEVVEVANTLDLISKAFRSNVGGSKPPTRADIDYAIEACLNEGAGERKIPEVLGMPAGMLRGPIQLVKARMKKQKINAAIDLMAANNLRPSEAAEVAGVDEEELRTATKTNRKRGKGKIQDVTIELTKQFRTFGRRNNLMVEKLIQQFDDGDISAAGVVKILEHRQQLQKRQTKTLEDQMGRFLAKTKAHGKGSEATNQSA
ncbi:MAG: hypothetical protein EXS48_01070 [Candidatus Staskawiczbacteria bacterium]|nr:hypothetical protein [Candidatus Staskawiczbacteria bacterium]